MKLKAKTLSIMAAAVVAAAAGMTQLGRSAAEPAPDLADLLTKVTVVKDIPLVPGYDRECGQGHGCVFGPRWSDPQDHSGCDTRNRILIAQLSDVQFKPKTRNCKVASGWRVDPYTGERIELAQIQIDHVVSLHRAWNAGASKWDLPRRRAFANDIRNLEAVKDKANRDKSDSSLSQWMPPNVGEHCHYALQYLNVSAIYTLPITEADRDAAIQACPKGT